jgi:hypothetical protein
MKDIHKGQIWRNKRTNQLERINYAVFTEPFVKTEHYLRSTVSAPISTLDIERVSHKEALEYVDAQQKFEALNLPPLPLPAGV